jgi:CheY-like chemotaxis protein
MRDLLERAVGTGVQIQTSVPENLAPAQVDANQLELAILNLAVNARDAMPLGGSLFVAAREQTYEPGLTDGPQALASGDYICIEVTDSGVGMDEATLARATEPFFTTKGPGKGTGLGLSMIHGLVAQSGGDMVVSSQVGVGTTVQLWLPEAPPFQEDALQADRARTETEPSVPAAVPLTILLVDDDALVRTSTAAMLEDLGHVVIEAESGPQALERLAEHGAAIDLVITDHAMPGMRGAELIGLLKTMHPTLPAILASGYAEILEDQSASVLRLSKPFRRSRLAAAINSAVEQRPEGSSNVIPLRTSG